MANSASLPLRRVIGMFIGLVVVAAAMTILFLAMRAVMDVGGFCAEGGPYQIAVHCPQGIAVLMPLSIIAGLAAAALYAFCRPAGTPNITFLLWPLLFGSLGWNFLEYGYLAPDRSAMIAWLVCGVLFALMALVPLWLVGASRVWAMLRGIPDAHGRRQPAWFALLHALVLVGGIWGGFIIYLKVTGQVV